MATAAPQYKTFLFKKGLHLKIWVPQSSGFFSTSCFEKLVLAVSMSLLL